MDQAMSDDNHNQAHSLFEEIVKAAVEEEASDIHIEFRDLHTNSEEGA